MKALLPILALILAVGLALSAAGPAAAQQSPTIQLAVLLDGSVSVDSTEWDIQINGLVAAIDDSSYIPHDGSVELTVIQFGGELTSTGPPPTYDPGAVVYFSTTITSANAGLMAETVNTTIRSDKFEFSSPLHLGILAAIDEIGGENAITGAKQIINIVTNGGTDGIYGLPRDLAEQARSAAIAAGIDEISAEGLGDIITGPYGTNNHLWLRDSIVYPQPGSIAPPFTPGWVYLGADQDDGIQNAAEFTEAIGQKITRYTLTMAVTGSGATTPVVGPHDYTEGTVVDITATPASGWQFDGWTGDVADPGQASTTVTMDSNKTVTANFSEETQPTYQVDVSSNPTGGGTVDPGSGQYVGNTMFTATANTGYDFVNWTINDVTGETDNPLTLDIQAVTTVEANFSKSEDGGGCFIATAAYGSDLDSHVETLRNFRDSYMVNNPMGSALVSAYYKLSPPVAEFIDDHPTLKPIVRAGLMPAVAMSTVAVNTTSAEKIAIVGSLALISILLITWRRQRSRSPHTS
jgi:uncharacterized repeat protein (TIGR02543 family)